MSRDAGWLSWRMVLPWSVALCGLFAAAHLAIAWAIKCEAIRNGQRRVGAQVEIGDTRVNLLASRTSFRDIRVANPESPLRNLVQADRCDLQLDPVALLHKQAVIQYGTVAGLRFGTLRETSGALPGVEATGDAAIDGWLDESAIKQAQDWLDQLHERFDRNLVDRLESIHLVEQLMARWPEQSAALDKRVTELRNRTAEFHAQVREAQENPLRHVDFLQHLPKDISRIRDQMAKLSDEIAKLPNVADEDRRAIVAAREHDEKLLRDELALEPLDTNVLSAYLLQKQLTGPLADLLGWLRIVRRIVPAEPKPVDSHSHRGHEILFTGCRRTPELLIRKLQLRGSAEIAGQSLEFVGTVSDFSDKPALHDRPIKIHLAAKGSLPLEVTATVDRTGPVARDQLVAECGGIILPKLSFGSSNKFRLSLAPTTASLNVIVRLEGDKLSGDVRLVQHEVQITPTVGDELVRRHFDSELEQALANIDSLETRIALAGTLDQPQCQIWSNLGPAVADALRHAVEQTTAGYARELLAESQNRVDDRLAELEHQVADAQASLEPQLEDASDSLDQLTRKTAPERLSIDHLGRRLPEDSLFR